MKLITILVEQASVEGLSTVLPQTGVASVTISEVERFGNDAVAVEVYRGATPSATSWPASPSPSAPG